VGLKLSGTHQLLVYVDYVNIFGYERCTTKENTIALIDASKEVGVEVNPEKTKYMLMSRYQNELKNRNTRKANISSENVAK
jgi:hypothetical protein